MFQHLCLLLIVSLLARLQVQIFQLLELEAQIVLVGLVAFESRAGFVQLAHRRLIVMECGGVLLSVLAVMGHDVQDIQLEVFLSEQQVLVL